VKVHRNFWSKLATKADWRAQYEQLNSLLPDRIKHVCFHFWLDQNWKPPTYPACSQKTARNVPKAVRSLGTTSVTFLSSAGRTRAQTSESEAGSFCVPSRI